MSLLRLPLFTLAGGLLMAACSTGQPGSVPADAGPDSGAQPVILDAGVDAGPLMDCVQPDLRGGGSVVNIEHYSAFAVAAASFPQYGDHDFVSPRLGCRGPCEVRPGYVFDAGLAPSDPAGDLVIEGVQTSSVIMAQAQGRYTVSMDHDGGVPAAQRLTVRGLGADGGVPPFQVEVPMPSRLNLQMPPSSAMTAPRNQPLTLSWTTTASVPPETQVVVRMVGPADNPVPRNAFAVRCTYPAAAGQGEIPAEILGIFAPGRISFRFSAETSAHTAAGSYEVWLQATDRDTNTERTLDLQ